MGVIREVCAGDMGRKERHKQLREGGCWRRLAEGVASELKPFSQEKSSVSEKADDRKNSREKHGLRHAGSLLTD